MVMRATSTAPTNPEGSASNHAPTPLVAAASATPAAVGSGVNTRTSYATTTGALSSPLAPLVEPYPAPRLYRSRLDRGVGVLQAVPERDVLGRGEPVKDASCAARRSEERRVGK